MPSMIVMVLAAPVTILLPSSMSHVLVRRRVARVGVAFQDMAERQPGGVVHWIPRRCPRLEGRPTGELVGWGLRLQLHIENRELHYPHQVVVEGGLVDGARHGLERTHVLQHVARLRSPHG